jgi:hypothetical protein
MRLPLLKVYAGYCLLLEVDGVNLASSNQKLRLYRRQERDAIQMTILPLDALSVDPDLFKGRGALTRAQDRVCADNCEFRGGRAYGGCYVHHLGSKARKAYAMLQADSIPTVNLHHSYIVRATVWGDLGKAYAMDSRVMSFIKPLLERASRRLAYVSDFEAVPHLRGLALASCQTADHVDRAISLGWKVYASTYEAKQALRALSRDHGPLYKCPASGKRNSRYECSTCSIVCDGQKHVLSYEAKPS